MPSDTGLESPIRPQLPPLAKWQTASPAAHAPAAAAAAAAGPGSPPTTSHYPKTSRFNRSVDNSNSPSSSDQFSPYLYPQQKSRPNAPLDISQISSKTLVQPSSPTDGSTKILKTDAGYEYTLQAGSVPCFHLSLSNLPDPITFYQQVEEIGRQYGAVKLQVLPQSGSAPISDFNTELFWFRARRQALSSFQLQNKRKLELHRKLYHYHKKYSAETGTPTLAKIPTIDKRPLDLYRLRECVQLRGGFQEVCHRKLWAQIGRELGYSGRIMSSLSTSLRSAYLKVFSEFDKFETQQDPTPHPAPAKLHIILPSSNEEEQKSSSRKRAAPENPTMLESSFKIQKLSATRAFQATGTSAEFSRLRDILRYKGFYTNFEALTEPRKNITKPSLSTLPGYHFSFWKNSSEIFDKSVHECKNSPIYNLRQFYEKSCTHFENVAMLYKQKFGQDFDVSNTINLQNFEKLFFDILADDAVSCSIDSGIDVPASVHGSGFPIISKSGESLPGALSPWNLNNVATSENSMLRYLDADFGNHLDTKLDIGMLFSVKGWSIEDNFLASIHYHHVGSSKLWYVIPPQDMEKFERLIEFYEGQPQDVESSYPNGIETKQFEKSEFYQSFLDTTPSRPTSMRPHRVNTHTLNKNFQSSNSTLANDWHFHPETLKDHGITVYKVVQDPQSFIFRFPKSFSSNISSGFSVSEFALFAPTSWLGIAIEGEKWLSKNGLLPGISIFPLLLNIVQRAPQKGLAVEARHILKDLALEELRNRHEFATRMEGKYETHTNTFDFISDTNLEPTGVSKVVLANDKDCLTVSVKQFLDNVSSEDGNLLAFGCELEKEGTSVSLHIFCSDDQLESLLQEHQAYLDAAGLFPQKRSEGEPLSGQEIKKSFDNLVNGELKGRRVPMSQICLYYEALSDVPNALSDQLKDTLAIARSCAAECNHLLDTAAKEKFKHSFDDPAAGFAIKELPIVNFHYTMLDLQNLYMKLQTLSIEFPEMHEIYELCHRAEVFQDASQMAIKNDDLVGMQEAYVKGCALGVSSKYHSLLARKICNKMWLSVYESAFVEGKLQKELDPSFKMEDLPDFLQYGVDHVHEPHHLEKLRQVRGVIMRSQDAFLQLKNLFKKKTVKISVKKLSTIMSCFNQENLLLDPQLLTGLNAILDAFEKRKQSISSSFGRFGINDSYSSLLTKENAIDDLFKLDLIQKFDGSATDQRLTLLEVPNKSIFSRHVKDCKSWLQKANKLVSKRQMWAKVANSANQCLADANDLWIPEPNKGDGHYCFCRGGDSGSRMVACEVCGEWYHMNCINKGKWALASSENTVFVCPICSPAEVHDFGVIDYSSLEQLAIASCQLKVIPERQFFAQFFDIFKVSALFRRILHQELFCKDQTLQDGASPDKVKFYLRKILGSGVFFEAEVRALEASCRGRDEHKLQSFLQKDIHIVTGFEEKNLKKEDNPPTSGQSNVLTENNSLTPIKQEQESAEVIRQSLAEQQNLPENTHMIDNSRKSVS